MAEARPAAWASDADGDADDAAPAAIRDPASAVGGGGTRAAPGLGWKVLIARLQSPRHRISLCDTAFHRWQTCIVCATACGGKNPRTASRRLSGRRASCWCLGGTMTAAAAAATATSSTSASAAAKAAPPAADAALLPVPAPPTARDAAPAAPGRETVVGRIDDVGAAAPPALPAPAARGLPEGRNGADMAAERNRSTTDELARSLHRRPFSPRRMAVMSARVGEWS